MNFPVSIPILGPVLARRRMKVELAGLATRWSLGFVESDQRSWWGRFTGTLEGYPVVIDPDGRSLTVTFSLEIGDFQCSTLDVGRKPRDHGLGHPRFEKVFPWIELDPRAADALRNRPDVLDRILTLWCRRVAGITLGNGLLTCVLNYPFDVSKGPHYVEASDVERLLPEMIGVVRLLESVRAPGAPAAS